jgi:hypothetical protein
MIPQPDKLEAMAHGEHVLRRIQWLTLGFGLCSAAAAAGLHRVDWAKGLLCGAALGWLNFRWLQSGIRGIFEAALAQANATSEGGEPAVSSSNSATLGVLRAFTLLFRYALVGLCVYVIFIYLHVPLVSIGLGLCALVAAIVTASVWEAMQPET